MTIPIKYESGLQSRFTVKRFFKLFLLPIQILQAQNGLQSRFTVKRFFKSFLLPIQILQAQNGLQSRFTVKRFFKSFLLPIQTQNGFAPAINPEPFILRVPNS
ncbi:MAG: hypothetical protein BWK80_23235 [Desulfobacteraceae bacterium IS3]|nr:MAG: hypothetical protein BWK80_23235 [Desulfobacteraceae bacterium IS3]